MTTPTATGDVETVLDPDRGQTQVILLDGDDVGDVDIAPEIIERSRPDQIAAFGRIAASYQASHPERSGATAADK